MPLTWQEVPCLLGQVGQEGFSGTGAGCKPCPVAVQCTAVLLYCCRYHALTLTLLKAAWRRAQALVAARADAIMKVARELIDAEDEKIEGKRLVEIIEVRGAVGWGQRQGAGLRGDLVVLSSFGLLSCGIDGGWQGCEVLGSAVVAHRT